jgi:hypothetical protein
MRLQSTILSLEWAEICGDMFKHLVLSREIMREYHDKLAFESSGQKLTVMVLQRSAWPFTMPKSGIDLTPAVGLLFPLRRRFTDGFIRRRTLQSLALGKRRVLRKITGRSQQDVM